MKKRSGVFPANDDEGFIASASVRDSGAVLAVGSAADEEKRCWMATLHETTKCWYRKVEVEKRFGARQEGRGA